MKKSSCHTILNKADGLIDCIPNGNRMGAMSYVRYDQENSSRPLFALAFEGLETARGKLGIFETGVYRTIKLNGLKIKLFQYSSANSNNASLIEDKAEKNLDYSIISFGNNNDKNYQKAKLDNLHEKLIRLLKKGSFNALSDTGRKLKITFHKANARDVAEARINHFDYQKYYDDQRLIKIEAARAIANYKQPDIILRGHVKITGLDGKILQCNHAKWDIKNEQFKINGTYVLRYNEKTVSGKGICLDNMLNVIKTQHATNNEKEIKKCFAKN